MRQPGCLSRIEKSRSILQDVARTIRRSGNRHSARPIPDVEHEDRHGFAAGVRDKSESRQES